MTAFPRWGPRRPEEGIGWGGMASLALHVALAAWLFLPAVAPRREAAPQSGLEIVWDEEMRETVGEGGSPSEEAALPGQPPSPPPVTSPESAPEPSPPPRIAGSPVPPLLPMRLPVPLPTEPADGELPSMLPPPEAPVDAPAAEPVAAEPAPAEAPPLPLPPPPTPTLPPRSPTRPQAAAPPAAPATEAPSPGTPGPLGQGRVIGGTSPPAPDERFARSAPAYPETARLRGEQGVVVMELAIGTDGRVITARVTRSSGSMLLDEAARRAAQDWRFRPALIEGQPTVATVQTSVQFRLQ